MYPKPYAEVLSTTKLPGAQPGEPLLGGPFAGGYYMYDVLRYVLRYL